MTDDDPLIDAGLMSDHGRRRAAGLLLWMVVVVAICMFVMGAVLTYVAWQVYSCTQPGQACYDDSVQRTTEVVTGLDSAHQKLIDEINRLQRQVAALKEER